MNVLEDQIFAVCRYLGGSYNDSYLNDNGEISYNYKYYKDDKKATIQEIFDHMVNPDYSGGYNDDQTVYTPNEYIGDKPFQCLKCHSSNVAVSTEGNICRNDGCGAKGSDIYTYCDMMQNIADSYHEHSVSGKTIVELRADYRNQFDIKTYLGDTLYIELRSFIREDVYNNSNFTSDGLSNSQIIEQAKELKAKAEQELAKACNPQYSVTTSLSSVVAQKEFVYQGVTVNDDYSKFMINNYVRVLIDEELYKMRLTSITFQFPVTDKIEVTFSNVTNCKTNTAMNVKEILDSAASMATSYDYVATQADKGAVANDQFVDIMNEGLNASLMAVKNSRDQDVVIDNHGILLRKKIHETDEYSPYQMKLINRNIVMTDDNWETAKLAIGLGLYEGVERYGVWADVICGNLIAGEKLVISNDDGKGNHTVTINGEGIDILNGSFKVSKPNGCTVIIDPLEVYGEDSDVFSITNSSNERIMGIDANGDGYFSGDIQATSGKFGQAEIYEATVYVPDFNDLANVEPESEDTKTTLRNCTLISSDYGMSERVIGNKDDGSEITTFVVSGNILDLDKAFLQFNDLKLYEEGIVKNITSNYDDIHVSMHYTKYWKCTENGIQSYYNGYKMMRGAPYYYNSDNSIIFNEGEGTSVEENAGLTSSITYKTLGTHIFEGNIKGAMNTKKMKKNTTYVIKAVYEIGGGTAAFKDLIQVKFGCSGVGSPLSMLNISATGVPSFTDISSSMHSYYYSTLSASIKNSMVMITFTPVIDGTFIFSNEWNTTITSQ